MGTSRAEPPSLEYTGLPVLQILEHAENYNRYLTDLVALNAPASRQAVDFGAGIGTFSKKLAARGFVVSCVEADEYLAAHLRTAGFQVTDLAGLPPGSTDYIFTLNVLEHIADDSSVLKALHEKLKVGGRLFIYVPAFHCLWSSLDDRVGHQRRYTTATLRQLVESVGFRVVRCRYADSLGFLAALLFKLTGNKRGDLSVKTVVAYDRLVMPLSRWLDPWVGSFFGKNVYLACVKE